MEVAPQYEAGKEVVAGSGCLACHKLGENGNNGPGPGTDPHRRPDPARGDHALGRNRARHHALLPRPAAEEAQRARRLPLVARTEPLAASAGVSGPSSAMDTINDNRDSPEFAGQVNRMFDRVAGHYDALNSVMTAGLHHRWRERAAERAGLGPGDVGARRLLRHRRPGPRAGRPGRPGRPRGRLRLLRADARPRPREGGRAQRRRGALRVGGRARACPTTAAASTRSRSASGSATSPTSTAACARWPGC